MRLLPAALVAVLLVCGCEPIENALNQIGKPKELPVLPKLSKSVIKENAPIPMPLLQELLKAKPLILEVACVSIEDVESTRRVKEDCEKKHRTTYILRRMRFKVRKVVKGSMAEKEFSLEDNDFSVEIAGESRGYFYQLLRDDDLASGADYELWKYAVFCDAESLEKSREIIMIRMPVMK